MPERNSPSPAALMSPELAISIDWPAGLTARIACRPEKSIAPALSIVMVESTGSRGRITMLLTESTRPVAM